MDVKEATTQRDPIFGSKPSPAKGFSDRLAARPSELETARSTMIESGRYDVVLGMELKVEDPIPLGELEVRDRRSGAILGRIVGLASG